MISICIIIFIIYLFLSLCWFCCCCSEKYALLEGGKTHGAQTAGGRRQGSVRVGRLMQLLQLLLLQLLVLVLVHGIRLLLLQLLQLMVPADRMVAAVLRHQLLLLQLLQLLLVLLLLLHAAAASIVRHRCQAAAGRRQPGVGCAPTAAEGSRMHLRVVHAQVADVQVVRIVVRLDERAAAVAAATAAAAVVVIAARVVVVVLRRLPLRVLLVLHASVLEPDFHLHENETTVSKWSTGLRSIDALTCRSVRFRLRASSQRFCFDTYALNKNSFSSSSVWNLE